MLFADCLKCGTGGCQVDTSEYPKGISIICPICGTNYLYKNDYGIWETSQQKMKRMEKHYNCKKCGKDVIVYSDFIQPHTKWCNDCDPEVKSQILKSYRKPGGIKNNTPWRVFVNYKKKETTAI